VDEATKEAMVARFRARLDALAAGGGGPATADEDESTDLRALHVELAALRTEVRAEARMFKDAFEQVRASLARAEGAEAAARREVERLSDDLREERQRLEARVLVPLLTGLIGLRDRLEAGLALPPPAVSAVRAGPPWYRRLLGAGPAPVAPPGTGASEVDAAWREGVRMTLDRLDRLLREHGVEAMELEGRPFDPRIARAVATAKAAGEPDGVVVAVVRRGFIRNGSPLRVAEVVVNKTAQGERT
jgi:molecular chaperone GrpE